MSPWLLSMVLNHHKHFDSVIVSPLGIQGLLYNFPKASKYCDTHEKESVLAENGVNKSVQQTC